RRPKRVTKIVILSEPKDRVTNSPAAPPNGAPLRMTRTQQNQGRVQRPSPLVLHSSLSEHSDGWRGRLRPDGVRHCRGVRKVGLHHGCSRGGGRAARKGQ